jgi:P-type Cu+ transporter
MRILKSVLLALAVATLHIEGMTCGACATSVRIVLQRANGVKKATVSYATKTATIEYEPALTSGSKLAATVEAALPYKARVVEKRK